MIISFANIEKQMLSTTNNFVKYVNSLTLDFNQTPEEFDYDNPVLILVDAVLSMNRRYDSFAKPRVEIIRKTSIKTLKQLLQAIKNKGIAGFGAIWHYNHPERVEILKSLTNKFMQIQKELQIDNELEAMKVWAKKSTINDYLSFNVKGIGFVTYQYLRFMCGADTAIPTVHLKRAVKDGTDGKLSDGETVKVVEETAKKLKIKARQLDYSLWKYYSGKRLPQ